jgi:hypothetical protein
MVLAACSVTGGASSPPAPVSATTTSALSVTRPSVSDVSEDSGITEAEVFELESVLDEIAGLVTDTEQLLDEPLP